MGKIKFTPEQQEIIEARNCNILVSAAAGSGKTAVLVERIISRVLDEKNPVDVDRFVIVTFTRAAAAQMKNRLRQRIDEELRKNPGNRYLQRQSGLVSSAHISTVHSFCGYVIQNYFHRIGLDPAYRQGTESELGLLRQETIDEILEREYEEEKPDFMAFAGMQMFNRSDERMAELVFELYDQAMGEPFPHEWIAKMESYLQIQSKEEWEKSELIVNMLSDCKKYVEGMKKSREPILKICLEPDGPYYFEKQLQEADEIFDALLACETYEQWKKALSGVKFSMMRGSKDETVNPDKKKRVADWRNDCKDEIKKLSEEFFSQEEDACIEELQQMAAPILTLFRLTKEFMQSFTEAKRERGIVDFNDLEQLALEILIETDEESGVHKRSQAALELSDFFEEIMIDEYQDSNRVQDTLLYSVSKEGREGLFPNLFMVGDVKQSIYRFRGACPELFSEKLVDYKQESGALSRRIDLHQNFRSRFCVLEAANQVFERVMHRDIGGVEYDEDAKLRAGRCFLESEEKIAQDTDLYVVVSDKADMEVEARQAVSIIRDMTDAKNPMLVAGKNEQDEDIYRPAQYRDIVILVRSVRAVGQLIFDVLSEAGIPVVMEQTQGFFDTREISLMTSILEVIDNPRQDFPLAAVLVGPMFGFTGEEMAKIRSESRDVTLYESLFCVTEEKLKEKIDHFLSVLEKLRDKKSFATVAELMEDIYEETGIYRSVRMMTDGVRRAANMDRLMEIAREFDATTYHGLYQFVRYIRRIREQQEEMGEVNIAGEEENVVRIMTIHKSKGLEFPIVFLLGMGKKLTHVNRSFLTIHPELGVAAPLCDTKKHTKKTTLYQSFLARKNRLEDLGEELRVLYVAMTRAEEKLVMIGTAPEKKLEANGNSYWERSRIESYLDMVLAPALSEQVPFRFHIAEKEELVEEVATELVTAEIDRTVLNNFDTDIRYHEDVHELLERMVNTFEEDEPLPVKVSVSDLKMKSMEELEDTDLTILSKEEISEEMPVPMFMQEKEAEPVYAGATYGTVWHQVMASIDFGKTNSESEIKEAVSELVRAGKLRPEETKMLNYRRLYTFFRSNLGKEMTNAWENGTLHSEQPFVIGRPAYELFPDRKEDKTVLVQGIIDGYYEKDGKIVLMDYKTDSLKSGEEGKLAERYKKQMDLYKQALEMILGKKVETCVLYSFSLGKEIEL